MCNSAVPRAPWDHEWNGERQAQASSASSDKTVRDSASITNRVA